MADSSIPITGGAGYNVDTRTTPGGDHREVVAIGDPAADNVAKVGPNGTLLVTLTTPTLAAFGLTAGMTPSGEMMVSTAPSRLFDDAFESPVLDVTDRWTKGGTIPPTISGTSLVASPGTANSASSWISSIPTFAPVSAGFAAAGGIITLEALQPVNPNCHRFWGFGQVTAYTAATPLTDGAGFEIDIDGSLQCVLYVGGTKYVVNSTKATNISSSVAGMGGTGTAAPAGAVLSNYGALMPWHGGVGRFAIAFRPDVIFWVTETADPIAVATYLPPNITRLPYRVAAITTPTGTVLSTTFTFQNVGVYDTTSSGNTIADATFSWRKTQVGKSGGLSVKSAIVAGTSASIAVAGTGTIGPLDVTEAGHVSFVVKNTVAANAYAGNPVLVFEQSDDNVSWMPLSVVADDTAWSVPGGVLTLAANTANGELLYNASLEAGATWVRCRVTTGPATNALTVSIAPGSWNFSPMVAAIPPPDIRKPPTSLTLTSGQAVTSTALNGQNTTAVQISGVWTGVLTFEATLDGATWVALNAVQVGSSNQLSTTTTVNGLWHVTTAGFSAVRVRCSTTGTGTATVSLAASANTGPPDQVGLWRADNVPRVAVEPTAVFTDSFEATLDVTDRWTTGGTTAPTASLGQASMNTGTAALAQSYMRSQPVFQLYSSAFQRVAMIVAIEAGVVTGNKAWWGLGTPSAPPTVASPITNGLVFEILDTDGLLYGAVYSGGARVQSVALVRPTDAGQHRYNIFSQTSRLYFEIDNIVVGSIALPNTQIGSLPLTIGSVNGASVLGVARTVNATIFGLSDTGRNASQLSDGTFQWRKAQIGKSGGLSVRGASITGSSTPFAATVTGTAGPFDVSEAGNLTIVVKNTIAANAYAGNPVLVFEQSDDNVSWAAMSVVRSDTQASQSTHVLNPGVANSELMFNAPMLGTAWVRVRLTTAATTNGITIAFVAGGMPFQPMVTPSSPARALVSYYALIPVLTSATDTLLSLTGTKGGATVGAATAPALVSPGKQFRITSFSATYIATATSGHALVRLRANTGGAVVIASPVYRVLSVGAGTPATANSSGGSVVAAISDGLEFPAGTGVGISVQGFSAATATAVGYVLAELSGYEY